MRPLADQSTLFISDVADVFSAGEGYCDNRANAVQGEQQWAPLQRTPHVWRTEKVSPRACQEMICETHATSKPLSAGLPFHHTNDNFSLHLHFCLSTKSTSQQTSSKLTNQKSFFFFFPLLLLFFSGEHAMQNVLSCNHRMFYFHCSECSGGIQRSASVPITANRERRARESAAQRKAPRTKKPKTSSEQARARVVWIFPPESRKFMLKHTSEAIFIFTHYYVIAGTDIKSKVWFKTFRRTSFLISRGTSPVDHGVKMTSLRGRHSARTAINSQLRTRGQHQSAV